MISTPSYPARRASSAQRAYAASVRSMPKRDSVRGRNGVIGERTADGATASG